MRKSILVLSLFLLAVSIASAQSTSSWTTPKQEVKFVSDDLSVVEMNSPVQTLTDMDFLTQAFYVLEQIKSTKQTPSEVIYRMTPPTSSPYNN